MTHRLLIATLIAISLLLAPLATASADDTELLLGKDYFTTLHRALQEAKDSIVVAMYIIKVPEEGDRSNPVWVLTEDLIDAKERGLSVKVVLDDSKFNVSYNAFKKLKAAGIDVSLDKATKLMHGKGVVIDGEICFIGSTNWTRASINSNDEFSILIRSPEVGKRLVDYISGIRLSDNVPVLREKEDGVEIPATLLTGKDGLSSIFTNHAQKAFDLYLYLVKKSSLEGSLEIRVDYEELGRYLGYTGNYYFNVRQPLNNLVRKYRLVTHRPWSKYLKVKPPADNTFTLPYAYWKYGLDKNLSFSAKFMYLVSLLEAEKSSRYPYWFRSNEDLGKMYHIGERSVSKGVGELEKEDILEVYRHKPDERGDFENRPANVYRLNPLVSLSNREDALKVLNNTYGEDTVEEARFLASQFNEPNDIAKIKTFIELINTYGYDRVKEVNAIVASKRIETGFRSIEDTIALLKK